MFLRLNKPWNIAFIIMDFGILNFSRRVHCIIVCIVCDVILEETQLIEIDVLDVIA